nr:MAG TPA: hypothetical protein [Caudoviricetes sp.]
MRILQHRKRIFFISSLVTIVETPFFVYLINIINLTFYIYYTTFSRECQLIFLKLFIKIL